MFSLNSKDNNFLKKKKVSKVLDKAIEWGAMDDFYKGWGKSVLLEDPLGQNVRDNTGDIAGWKRKKRRRIQGKGGVM